METQNHTSCKRNYTFFFLHLRGTNHIAGSRYTLLFFLHLRRTNHIAGSRLSIGKAGGYSKVRKCKNKTNNKLAILKLD